MRRLSDEPHRYSFFQLVHLLDRLHARGGRRVGYEGPPSAERLRFRPVTSMGFPHSDVYSFEEIEDAEGRKRHRIEVAFLGLYGTVTPLPTSYAEEVAQETAGGQVLLRDFLDIFHHRLLSLFYRCWEKYRYYIQFRPGGEDDFSWRMLCLIGLGLRGLPGETTVPRVRLLRYAGLLIRGSCPPSALAGAISDYHDGIRTVITPWVLRWAQIPPDLRNEVGRVHCRLGEDLHLGTMVGDRSTKFRITLGPMGLERFLGFLPGSRNFAAVAELVRLLVMDLLLYELETIVLRDEIPDLRLETASPWTRLGQTTWLGRPAGNASVVFQGPRDFRIPRANSGDGTVATQAA